MGYDAGKKVWGIKRHVLTDHTELLLKVVMHPASIQDRDGADDNGVELLGHDVISPFALSIVFGFAGKHVANRPAPTVNFPRYGQAGQEQRP